MTYTKSTTQNTDLHLDNFIFPNLVQYFTSTVNGVMTMIANLMNITHFVFIEFDLFLHLKLFLTFSLGNTYDYHTLFVMQPKVDVPYRAYRSQTGSISSLCCWRSHTTLTDFNFNFILIVFYISDENLCHIFLFHI